MKHYRLGDLLGNNFDIVIRDAEPASLEHRVNEINTTVSEGIPNYFGLQRFGASRPVTHLVGEWILKGNYEQAVITYVGQAFDGEAEHVREIRNKVFNHP